MTLQDEVHVWLVPLRVSDLTLAECEALLSDDERARQARLIRADLGRKFAVARGRLRQILSRYVHADPSTLRFSCGKSGKPSLSLPVERALVEFNVSHSGDLALVVVSRDIVGVDLEEIRELDYEAVGPKMLAVEDMALVSGAHAEKRAETFFQLWVRHEARLKDRNRGRDGTGNPGA